MRLKALGITVIALGMSAASLAFAARDSVTIKDKFEQERGPSTDIVKVEARDAGRKVEFVVHVPEAFNHTRSLTYVLMNVKGEGKFYASAVARDPEDRGYERVPAKIKLSKPKDTLTILVADRRIGSPNAIRFRVASGGTDGEDFAPNRGSKPLAIG